MSRRSSNRISPRKGAAGGPISRATVGTAFVITGVALAAVYVIDYVIQARKLDIQQVRDSRREVARKPGCRQPTPDDYNDVLDISELQKGLTEQSHMTYCPRHRATSSANSFE